MFLRQLFSPKILGIVALYSIVVFSWWPVIIWAGLVAFIGVAEGILMLKDYLSESSSYRNAPVVYYSKKKLEFPKNNENDEIDWSGFDIGNYQRESYRKIYWEHKPLSVIGGVKYKYPAADIIIGIYIGLFAALTYVEMILENFELMRTFGLSAFLFFIYGLYIPFGGKRFFEEECKDEYRYYFLNGK